MIFECCLGKTYSNILREPKELTSNFDYCANSLIFPKAVGKAEVLLTLLPISNVQSK